MSQPEKVRARVRLIDERLARLRAEKERLVARANKTERRRDARRKLAIGGTVLAALDREGVPEMQTTAELLQWLESRLTRPPDRVVVGLRANKSA
jgi:hypothetical protein